MRTAGDWTIRSKSFSYSASAQADLPCSDEWCLSEALPCFRVLEQVRRIGPFFHSPKPLFPI